MLRRTFILLTLTICLGYPISAQTAAQTKPETAKAKIGKPPALKKKTQIKLNSSSATTKRSKKYPGSDTKRKKKQGSDSKKKDSGKSVSGKKAASSKQGNSARKKSNKVDSEKPDRKQSKTSKEPSTSESEGKPAAIDASKPVENKQPAPKLGENESIPFMKKTTDSGQQPTSASGSILLKTIGSVLLILGLLFVGTWVFKKTGLGGLATGKSDNAPELQILSSVTPKSGQTISAVKFGERVLLVGSTAQSFTLLSSDGFENNTEMNPDEEFPFDYEGKPVSVAELLEREETSFQDEMKKAENNMSLGLGGLG